MKKTFVVAITVILLASASSTATAGSGTLPMPPTCKQYKISTANLYAGEFAIEAISPQYPPSQVHVDRIDKKKRKVCFRQAKPGEHLSFIFAYRIADGSVAGHIWTPHLNRWLRVTLPKMWLTT